MLKLIKYPVNLVLLLFLSLITGCCTKPDISLNGEYKFGRYISGAKAEPDLIVIASDSQNEINNWLKHQHKWCVDLNTYAPVSVLYADDFNINCTGNTIVLNCKSKSNGKWMQYSRQIDDEIKKVFQKLDASIVNPSTPFLTGF